MDIFGHYGNARRLFRDFDFKGISRVPMKYDFDSIDLPKLKQVVDGPTDVCATCDSDGKAHIHSESNWIHMEIGEAKRLARFLYEVYVEGETNILPLPSQERTFKVLISIIIICLSLGITIGFGVGFFV